MARVAADPDVLAGRYRLRQGRLAGAAHAVSAAPSGVAEAGTFQASDGRTLPSGDGAPRIGDGGARALPTDLLTVGAASTVPLLRLVTGGSAAETRVSGARAGRGTAVELLLPEEPTVSRLHARFVFRDGQWWVTGMGRNGLMVNEMPVRGEQVVRDGDLIRWGNQPGALVSRVQIGHG
jgi:hypothetical protein